MADSHHDIRVLNSLAASVIDSINGYTESAADAQSDSLRQTFSSRAQERRQVATMLQDAVRQMGGTPEDDGTALAGAHRLFLDLKAKVTGNDDAAVAAEVERGENHLRSKFEDALADNELSSQARGVVSQAMQSVQKGASSASMLSGGMNA